MHRYAEEPAKASNARPYTGERRCLNTRRDAIGRRRCQKLPGPGYVRAHDHGVAGYRRPIPQFYLNPQSRGIGCTSKARRQLLASQTIVYNHTQ